MRRVRFIELVSMLDHRSTHTEEDDEWIFVGCGEKRRDDCQLVGGGKGRRICALQRCFEDQSGRKGKLGEKVEEEEEGIEGGGPQDVGQVGLER